MRSACLALLGAVTTLAQGSALDSVRIQPANYLAHVKALSADELEGRGNGTFGLERAARYVEMEFKKAGLAPGGDGVSFFLPGANWSIWEWIERGLRSEFFRRDRVAGRYRRWDKR